MNFSKSNLNKVSKYTSRLLKSFNANDQNKTKEYYDHFKYHIQLGGLDKEELGKKFESIDTLINGLKLPNGYKSFDKLYGELSKCNTDKSSLVEQNEKLTAQIEKLTKDLSEKTESITQIESTIKNDNELNDQIVQLNKTIEDLKSEKEINTNNYKTILRELGLTEKETSNDIKEKITKMQEKISRYDELINAISKQVQETGNDDNIAFENAIKTLQEKSKASEEMKIELEESKEKVDELNEQITKLQETSSELAKIRAELEKQTELINEKDNEISKLEKEIKELKDDKESNDEMINKYTNQFEEKLNLLLTEIYGSKDFSEAIIKGPKEQV